MTYDSINSNRCVNIRILFTRPYRVCCLFIHISLFLHVWIFQCLTLFIYLIFFHRHLSDFKATIEM